MVHCEKLKPMFSVIMCVHDGIKEQHLEMAVDSILNQTLREFEFLIYLDGVSNNGLRSVVDQIKDSDKRVLIFSEPTNRGLAYGLNFLINQSNTEWLARMDADDYSRADRLEKFNKFLSENAAIDVVGSYMSEFSSDINLLARTIEYPLAHEEMRQTFCYRNPLSHASAVIKKSFFAKAGQYPQFSITNEDTYLWLSGFTTDCKFANLPDNLYFARFDDSAQSRRNRPKKIFSDYIDRLRVIIDLNGGFMPGLLVTGYAVLSLLPGSGGLRKLYFRLFSR